MCPILGVLHFILSWAQSTLILRRDCLIGLSSPTFLSFWALSPVFTSVVHNHENLKSSSLVRYRPRMCGRACSPSCQSLPACFLRSPWGSLRGYPFPRTKCCPIMFPVLHMSSGLPATIQMQTCMLKPLRQTQLLCVWRSQFSDFNTSSFFPLSTFVICPILEKHLLETTFSHLKNTEKKCQILFPFAVLELQKRPKGSFIKYVEICAESWGFICQELDGSEFLLQLILTLRERKACWSLGSVCHRGEPQHFHTRYPMCTCVRSDSRLSGWVPLLFASSPSQKRPFGYFTAH